MESTRLDMIENIMKQVHVCIESAHNEQVQLEAVQYNEFLDKLVDMNFKIGVIKQAPLTLEKLTDYNVLMIGTPKDSAFTPAEIETIQEYVYNGGGLFIIGDQGADAFNRNNLNEITNKFGISFVPNVLINRRASSQEDEQLITTSDFLNHFVMRGIDKLALKSPCSLEVFEVDGAEAIAIANCPQPTEEIFWNGKDWVEKGPKKRAIIAISKYGAGKVLVIGTSRILSSLLNTRHGFRAVDNEKFIVNVFAWLVNREIYEKGKLKSVFVNVSLKPDLYFWIENELKNNDQFRDFNELVNFSIASLQRGLKKLRNGKE